MPADRDDGTLAEGMTRNDTCAGCGASQFWGVVQHYDGCPTPDVMAHPAALARRDQLLASFGDLYAFKPRWPESDPRRRPGGWMP